MGEGVEQVAQELYWQPPGGDDGGEFRKLGVLSRLAGLDAVEFGLVGGEPGETFGVARFSLVSDVVGGAGEAVDDLDRPAQAGGQKQGCNGKVLVVVDGHGGLRERKRVGWRACGAWRQGLAGG